MILDKIIEKKRLQLAEEMKQISIEGWKQKMKGGGLHWVQDFLGAVKRKGKMSVIAEVKKASPSKGILRDKFDPAGIAQEYCHAGIQAISVLTERNFFLGCDDDLAGIRQSSPLPILRKDFIIDLWQVYQSRYLGADAILLITSVLSDEQLAKFQAVAGILGMQCLVEVHDRKELERALESGARMIGINNRNLKTFEVDLWTTGRLINYIPSDRAVVSESGIGSKADIAYLKGLGVDAVLVGEAFMQAEAIGDKVKELGLV